MGSFGLDGSWRLASVLICIAACQASGTCDRKGSEQASAVEEQPVPGDIDDGIYEVIPRGPFHLDEALKRA